MARKTSYPTMYDDSWINDLADIITKPRVSATMFIDRKLSNDDNTAITYSFSIPNENAVEEVSMMYEDTRQGLAIHLALQQLANEQAIDEESTIVMYACSRPVKQFIDELNEANKPGTRTMTRRTAEIISRRGIKFEYKYNGGKK